MDVYGIMNDDPYAIISYVSEVTQGAQRSMTTPNDPWAAAGVTTTQPAQQSQAYQPPAQSAADGQWGATQAASAAGQGGSSFAGAYQAPQVGPSRLLAQQSVAPSMFNKTHLLGTERVGKVTKAPYDRQELDYDSRLPKFFSRSRVDGKATTTSAVDAPTGTPNDPILGTHIEMETAYRMDMAEAGAVSRDPSFCQSDDGTRVLVIGGKQPYKAFSEAIADAATRGIVITKDEDFVGLVIRAKRVGQTPNPSGRGQPSWVMAYRIEREA